MSIKGQGHSLILVKGHSDFKVKCLTFGLYTQVSDSGPPGPLVMRLYFLNHLMDLVHIWYDDRYRSKNFCQQYPALAYRSQKTKTRLKDQIRENHVYSLEGTVLMQSSELSECSSILNVGQILNWVMSGQKLGS